MRLSPRGVLLLAYFLMVAAILLGAFAFARSAHAQEAQLWDSVRSSAYEWTCEDVDGTVLSGHTRQDKAVAACSNRTLADGIERMVRSGTYRIVRLQDPAPAPEPEPEPLPEPEPDPSAALVTFGPISNMVEYPADISALAQDDYRWEITFTVNSLPRDGLRAGLASRDASGQEAAGHLSVWLQSDGLIRVRNQDIAGGGETVLASTTVVVPGQQYQIIVSVEHGVGAGLWVDEALQAQGAGYGGADNGLGLVVGGLCSSCKEGVGPHAALDGTVFMAIYDDPMPLPQPIASLEVSWVAPTHRVADANGEVLPLGAGELTQIRLYQTQPGERQLVQGVDPDQSGHEVTDLIAGVNYCFAVTAISEAGESDDSAEACKVP